MELSRVGFEPQPLQLETLESMFDIGDNPQWYRTEPMKCTCFSGNRLFDQHGSDCLNRTEAWKDWLGKISEAGLQGDRQRLELIILQVIRSLKKPFPDVSERLGDLLAQHSANPNGLALAGVRTSTSGC